MRLQMETTMAVLGDDGRSPTRIASSVDLRTMVVTL